MMMSLVVLDPEDISKIVAKVADVNPDNVNVCGTNTIMNAKTQFAGGLGLGIAPFSPNVTIMSPNSADVENNISKFINVDSPDSGDASHEVSKKDKTTDVKYSVVIWSEDEGVVTGVDVIGVATKEDAIEYVKNSYTKSYNTINELHDSVIISHNSNCTGLDYEECVIEWVIQSTNTKFSTRWVVKEITR